MLKLIKSPLNWVGNKYKYIDHVNKLVKGRQYNKVYELFLGTGNILLNLDCEANEFIGQDKQKLVPKLYEEIPKYTFTLDEIQQVIKNFNKFSKKENYYEFRDYWNEKFLNDKFDKSFIIETALLLKMCSNSMVRFNPKGGYFNQGFRGLGKKTEFFTESMKELVLNGLNELSNKLKSSNYIFKVTDFNTYEDLGNEDLLIIDPPYILRSDMYDTDFTKELDDKILDLISNTENDFIYFNYLTRDGVKNESLIKIVEDNNYKVIHINDKTLSGQGRKDAETKEVDEVIITNIK